MSHPPYFWHPKPAMVLEHLVQIGSAVKLPFYVYIPPFESVGTKLSTDLTLKLIERLQFELIGGYQRPSAVSIRT